MNCKFEFIYYVTRKQTEYINFHKHNCYELVYYLSGSGYTTIGEKEYNYSKNSYSIITPDTMHMEYIKKFIHENYNQNISLQTLAELSGYSYHHFRHIFKAETGLSPMNYIINVRIKRARQLLSGTRLPISTIAQES